MTIQARKLPAAAGALWVRDGWRLLRKQPFGFTALLFLYWLLLLAASAVVAWFAQSLEAAMPFLSGDALEFVGAILVAALTPALTVGFLQACRAVSVGLPAHPILLFAPFRAGRPVLVRLFALGALQMVALMLILLATSGTEAFRADPPAAATASTNAAAPAPATATAPTPTTFDELTPADQEAMIHQSVVLLKQGLAYAPIAILMWYAPMLVAWLRLPLGKALFFNLVALWRNRAAFLVFGLTWLAVWFALSILITLIAVVLNLANVVAVLMAPVVLVLLTWMYCSVYATYDTVFVEDAGQAGAAPGDPGPQ